jgi:hypothetical protein
MDSSVVSLGPIFGQIQLEANHITDLSEDSPQTDEP